jgi:hypothetical protein
VVLAAALAAGFAQKALFAVRGHPVADDVFAGAMAARKLNRNAGRPIEAMIPKLDEMIGESLVTTEEVRIVISRPSLQP